MMTWIICGLLASALVYLELHLNNKHGNTNHTRVAAVVSMILIFFCGPAGLLFSTICVIISLIEFSGKFKPVKDWLNKKV